MELVSQIMLWGFVAALIMGAVACKTHFCTMGAVSDWVNMGDLGRMRSWVLAIAIAIIMVAILDSVAGVNMSLTASGATGKPPYATPVFVWPRYLLGGLLFGIGMTLGSGCGNKTLVRIGGGNLKSVIVFLVMGAAAYLMIYTDFSHDVFLRWMTPLAVNFSSYGLDSQRLSSLLSAALGERGASLHLITGIALAAILLSWVLAHRPMRSDYNNLLAGVVVGLAVAAAWWVTAGPLGQSLLEEIDFMDQRLYDAGAQSFTFVKPSAHLYYFLQDHPLLLWSGLSFALVAAAGVIAGSFLYSLLSRKLRFEWFSSLSDFVRHVAGGALMGIGGVLSLGCTFGQAITGASTLAIGSFFTFAAIVLGAALTMKVEYYRIVYEDEGNFVKVLAASLADLRLLPDRWRCLDKV